MKINILIVLTIFLLLWESLLGHVGIFQSLDLFAIFSVLMFLHYKNKSQTFIWIFIVGLLLDLVIVRWIGTYSFSVILSFFILLGLDRFIKVIDAERDYFTIVVFMAVCELIIYFISIVNGASFNFGSYVGTLVLNIIIAFCIKRLFFRFHQKTSIKI